MIVNATHAAVNPAAATGTGSTTGTGSPAAAGSASGTGPGTSASGSPAGATLGGTDFLTLMLAQLKNQDPTSPVDSNTFLTQLAQLSEVQGITSLNTSFNALSSSFSSGQALQASSLLGHQAQVKTSTAQLGASGSVTGAVNVPQTTSAVVLSVADAGGNVVQTIGLGPQSAGLANFSWDGKQVDGTRAPPGTYTLSVQYAGQTKTSTVASTLVNGTVESVSIGAGSVGMTLNVAGVGSVPFADLQQISN
jgi:flagellar basal-body rod modification protein FlgD